MYNRFFSFGCSYTQHLWPTWADIIAMDLKIPFQNWGKTGAGNSAIQSRVVECDFKNKLTVDDLVIVMWTGWNREDRYINGWLCGGMIFNNWNYDKNFIEKYWSLENDYIRSSTAIYTTYKAYKDIIKCHAAMTLPEHSMEFNHNHKSLLKSQTLDVAENILKNFYANSVELRLFDNKTNSFYNGRSVDSHPDILSHLHFVTNNLYPALNLEIKKDTVNFCKEYFHSACFRLSLSDNYDALTKKILKINEEFGFKQEFWGI